ncbi:MAG: hypothetical protein EBZ59_07275 [Planctomycetia bacterium]|nr:hypothetical protein [Planctomycetia bacterium]
MHGDVDPRASQERREAVTRAGFPARLADACPGGCPACSTPEQMDAAAALIAEADAKLAAIFDAGKGGVDPRVVEERGRRMDAAARVVSAAVRTGERLRAGAAAYAPSSVPGHTDPILDMLPAGTPARMCPDEVGGDRRMASALDEGSGGKTPQWLDRVLNAAIGLIIGLVLGAFAVACVVMAFGGGR